MGKHWIEIICMHDFVLFLSGLLQYFPVNLKSSKVFFRPQLQTSQIT